MRPVARVAATLVICALAAPGCFEARLRNEGPLVIDDFEDGDYTPELPGFDDWMEYAINDAEAVVDKSLVEGAPGSAAFGLNLDFHIDDPADGKQEHGGAGLVTRGHAPMDVSAYQTFAFSAKLGSGNPALPTDALLYIELGCSTAIALDDSSPGDLYVVTGAKYDKMWQQFRLDVTTFGFPPWNTRIMAQGGPARCRQLVDSIRFTVDGQLLDGLTGEGVLTVDDIKLE